VRSLRVPLPRGDPQVRRLRPADHVPLRRGLRAGREQPQPAHNVAGIQPARRQFAPLQGRTRVDLRQGVCAAHRIQLQRRSAEALRRRGIQHDLREHAGQHRLRLHRWRLARSDQSPVAGDPLLMRRLTAVLVLLALVIFAGSCGTGFSLPPPARVRDLAGNGRYERIDTWKTLPRISDLLLTKTEDPANEQLYLMFKTDGPDSGSVVAYPRATQNPLHYVFKSGLMNPVAITGNSTRLYVLDQGDSCLARRNPATGKCDTTGNYLYDRDHKWTNRVAYLEYNWRVREYFPDGDTASTFTDTTMAWVQGVAVDNQQRVYVSGLFYLVVQTASFEYSRTLVWRIHRYLPGGGDRNMPGCAWHRAPAYSAAQGSGLSNVSDPRGLDWGPDGYGALYVADTGNTRGLRRSDPPSLQTDYSMVESDQGDIGTPLDISVDLA